jgi:hypothetical protein
LTAQIDALSPSSTIDFGKVKVNWRKKGNSISTTLMELPKMDVPNELVRIVAGILV